MPVAGDQAEKTVLGSILVDEDAFAEAASVLEYSDFSLDAHRKIFRVADELFHAGRPIDLVTVTETLLAKHEAAVVGGISYVSGLLENLPRRIPVREYAAIIREQSRVRKVAALCQAIGTRCDGSERHADLVAEMQDGIEDVIGGEQDDASVASFTTAALDHYKQERRLERSPGLSYGIEALDEFSGGMRPGEVTVVGARSGVGKTSLMCQAAVANCKIGLPVALFSLEMTREQILRRIWSIVSRVPYKHITDPWLSNVTEERNVSDAAQEVMEWPLRIYDKEDLNLGKITSLGRICIRRHKVRLIVVDYAQEVDAPGRDERAKVMLVCRRLTRMVKHENCSLMLLSQLVKIKREDYSRAPVVGDLIESGKLENVAHLVLLLHRGWNENERRLDNNAELIIPKQRRGETGVLQAAFNRRTATFEGA